MKENAYIVIGKEYRTCKRFRRQYPHTDTGLFWAMGINLWNGRVWERIDGKMKLIKSVTN